jgi:flagellar assembly factor FliW
MSALPIAAEERVVSENALTSSPGATTPTVALRFVRPIIGFRDAVSYELRMLGPEYAPYRTLAALDLSGLEFICIAPGHLFEDYTIEISDDDAALLGIESADDVEVIVLVSTHGEATPTVNLLGPIVINRRTGAAGQLVLQEERFGVAVPVTANSALG